MAYKCSDVLPQASLVDIYRNNMRARIRSMIIGNKSKNLGELQKASMEAETVIKDLNSQKSSKKEPTAIQTSKPKEKKVFNVQTKSTPQPPKKAENKAPEGQPIWVHPDLLEDENWEIVKTRLTAQLRRQAKRQLHSLKQQEKAQTRQGVPEKAETSFTASLGATEESLPKASRVARKFTLGSLFDDDEDQEIVQKNAVNPALANALVDPNEVEPQGADEEEDLAPMPDLEEYARILQRLAIEQEQDRINQLHQNPELEVPEDLQTSPPNASGSISSGATSSQVTSTEISSSQPSSPETMTSDIKPLPTDHHEEALADEDLLPENAPCNAITEDGNAAAEAFSANGEDQALEPEGGLPKEEPPLEAFEVGKAINALSGNDNENAGPKEAFKLNLDVDKHAPQVLQIETDYRVKKSKTSSKGEKKEAGGPCTECLSVQKAGSATFAFNKEDLLLGETKHNRPLYFTGYIKEMSIHRVQIDPGSALNLIFTTALEELGIPPSKLSHTSVSIFGFAGSAQRPIGEIKFKLQIDYLISECIKFVSNNYLIHLMFADKKPFKGKEVHFADSQMYRDEKEEKEEKIASFVGNLQKDKGKVPQQSSEENKPSRKPEESNPSPFVVSFKSSKPLVITTKAKKTKQMTGGKFVVSFVSIIQDTDSDSETKDDTSSNQADAQQSHFADHSSTSRDDEDIDLPGYLFEELPDKDPGSSSNWYDFSNDEKELSDGTDAQFSNSEEPSSLKEVPYFDPILTGDWDHLIASLEKSTDQEGLSTEAEPWSENVLGNPEGLVELKASKNIVEEPPSNL
ncbi:hypothetical protein MRB53_028746 [Persea americana]|uniref:Uncharacterized protein n=1 Tax=Persea americana TaxID=3435 RepID=A0ACC2KGC8_PERAE|nr:hypothetical protein MRB53_028746 [Persea americana]